MKELDFKGMRCPMPVIKLGQAIKQLADGEEVRVVADDKGFSPDVRAWTDKTGHELVELDEHDPANIVAIVRKKK